MSHLKYEGVVIPAIFRENDVIQRVSCSSPPRPTSFKTLLMINYQYSVVVLSPTSFHYSLTSSSIHLARSSSTESLSAKFYSPVSRESSQRTVRLSVVSVQPASGSLRPYSTRYSVRRRKLHC